MLMILTDEDTLGKPPPSSVRMRALRKGVCVTDWSSECRHITFQVMLFWMASMM